MIQTLLIANRGEIALRVIRGARALGIRTVAVYSDADRNAPHVREADTAVHIGPTPATESYLSIPAILEAARVSGADAIHPGYGFLSERAPFARAVAEAGLTFVGPSGDVMDQMGRKDTAREIAIAAGVPVVPRGEDAGFPVLVKAAAGGGGKGMRVVRRAEDFDAAVSAAKREAASAFGDDTILVERYVEHGRHVEVQVLADHHGNVVHLFERDCSAQRRHQKVLEEAPAPTISDAARKVLLESAVALAKQVGYTNAGTVEYLVSGDEVFFLEMNTRLQVEHPVTELTVSIQGQGLDLVQLQLRVAAGEPLPFTQEDVTCTGHAIEARVYAEDAFNGFLPQAGTASYVSWSSRARIDAALESGSVVGTSYDPMLGKVIVHGPDRETARRKLVAALDDTAILGLTTNTGFLRALAASDEFRDNAIDTAWLDAHPDAIAPPSRDVAALLAAHAVAGDVVQDANDPFGAGDGWRLAGEPAPVHVELDDEVFLVDVTSDPLLDRAAAVQVADHAVEVAYRGQRFHFARPQAGDADQATASDGTLAAPMPGTVLTVNVAVGDRVEEGDVLGVMEAMKMELALKAPLAGTVTTVGAAVGEQVPLKHVLFVVSSEPGSDA
ncbi:MAG TPA: biotin carboxylase N-terminal domain-containing protein [Nocardioidaceae bacterium]|nr:biotin carboxylase N-terminal domain-containing protein [Nocardioidaceae bacterium]